MPDAPENFIVTVVDSNTLNAAWDEPLDANGVLTNYRLNIHVLTDYLGSEYNETFDLGSNQFSYTVSGLHPFAMYRLELRAITSVGAGSGTTAQAETAQDGRRCAHYRTVASFPGFQL